MGGQGQLGIAHTDPDPDCSSSHTSRHEASGDENAPAVDTNTSHDASVFVSGPPDAKDSHGDAGFGGGMKKTPSAPLRPNKPPLAPSKTPRSQSARKGVMSGSKWGSADATKALQSLSSCQGSVSLNLGHEGLFSSALFTADDWKEHTSFKRWLPEPLYLCVATFCSHVLQVELFKVQLSSKYDPVVLLPLDCGAVHSNSVSLVPGMLDLHSVCCELSFVLGRDQ